MTPDDVKIGQRVRVVVEIDEEIRPSTEGVIAEVIDDEIEGTTSLC
jgi:hypothetical protein